MFCSSSDSNGPCPSFVLRVSGSKFDDDRELCNRFTCVPLGSFGGGRGAYVLRHAFHVRATGKPAVLCDGRFDFEVSIVRIQQRGGGAIMTVLRGGTLSSAPELLVIRTCINGSITQGSHVVPQRYLYGERG